MAVKIRLKRMGKIRNPQYRIVVADSRTKRDGRAIEEIGRYHPKEDPSLIEVNSERARYWLGVGAQPSEPVQRLLELTGDWQRHKGDANAESKVQPPKARADKRAAYEAASKESAGVADSGRPAKKAAESEAPAGSEPAR